MARSVLPRHLAPDAAGGPLLGHAAEGLVCAGRARQAAEPEAAAAQRVDRRHTPLLQLGNVVEGEEDAGHGRDDARVHQRGAALRAAAHVADHHEGQPADGRGLGDAGRDAEERLGCPREAGDLGLVDGGQREVVDGHPGVAARAGGWAGEVRRSSRGGTAPSTPMAARFSSLSARPNLLCGVTG
ncbi:hypothetical protein D1007_50456 [Hordeum vulgare]|nr:hypothetical protein D1007_50456 [Hordeum vulgare]